jgi:hypothetical protein
VTREGRGRSARMTGLARRTFLVGFVSWPSAYAGGPPHPSPMMMGGGHSWGFARPVQRRVQFQPRLLNRPLRKPRRGAKFAGVACAGEASPAVAPAWTGCVPKGMSGPPTAGRCTSGRASRGPSSSRKSLVPRGAKRLVCAPPKWAGCSGALSSGPPSPSGGFVGPVRPARGALGAAAGGLSGRCRSNGSAGGFRSCGGAAGLLPPGAGVSNGERTPPGS